jgi:hypothetical protein
MRWIWCKSKITYSPVVVGKSILTHTRLTFSRDAILHSYHRAGRCRSSFSPVDPPRADEIIPGKYIVQLKPDTDVASITAHHNKVRSIHARNLARRGGDGPNGTPVEREYGFGNFKAYAGSFDDATIEELKALPEVSRVAVPNNMIL